MADVNKTIEISMKADLKQLLDQFKKMPGITEKEAKKMVSGLQKELRQAQKAAEKVARTNKKAMKQVEISSKKAALSVKGLRRQTRELGGSFNAMGDVLGEVNPEFTQFAMGAELAGDGFRSFSRIMATGNPILIGIVAAITAGVAAYALFTAKATANKKSQEALEKVLTETTAKIRAQQQAADDAADSMFAHASAANESALDLQVMNGILSESDLSMLKLEKRAADMSDQIVSDGDKQIKSLKTVTDQYKARERAIEQNIIDLKNSGEAYKTATTGIVGQTVATSKLEAKQRELRVTTVQRKEAEESLNTAIEQNANLAEETSQRFFEIEKEKLNIRKRERRDREREKKQRKSDQELKKSALALEKALRKERERMEKIDDEISASREQALESNFSLEIGNRQRIITMMDSEKDKLEAQLQLEKDLITKKEEAIKSEISRIKALAEDRQQEIEANETIAEQEKGLNALQKERNILEDEFAEKKEALTKKLIMQNIAEANSIASMVVSLAKATSQLIGNLTEKDKESAMMQFRISQGIAIAEIAMTTATNIAKMFPNPIMMGAAGALGAVQAGVVLSTPPPEFHMGGMINKGPDTQLITALKGEGIVDRSTMREIGGEEGLRRIKQGTMNTQEVIVRTPFKHFDNYSKVSIKRNGALSRLQRTRSIGVY